MIPLYGWGIKRLTHMKLSNYQTDVTIYFYIFEVSFKISADGAAFLGNNASNKHNKMDNISISGKSPWTLLAIIDDGPNKSLYGETKKVSNKIRTRLRTDVVYAWQRDDFIMYHLKGRPMHRGVLVGGFGKIVGCRLTIFKDDIVAVLEAIEKAGFKVDWHYAEEFGNGQKLKE